MILEAPIGRSAKRLPWNWYSGG